MTTFTWSLARASGIVAWAMLAASVLWGLALSTRALGRRPRPNWLLDLHRFLGGAAVVFTGIHVIGLLFDESIEYGLTEVLVPFTGSWHPVAVAWGVISLYLLAAVELTSLLRARLSKRMWRMTHLLSFPLYALATAHTVAAGTDAANPILRAAVLASVFGVVALTTLRVIPDGDEPASESSVSMPDTARVEEHA